MAANTVALSTIAYDTVTPVVANISPHKTTNRRPVTHLTGRNSKLEAVSTSVVKFNRHSINSIPLPVASYYYYSSTFPSLYATFSTGGLRRESQHSNDPKKHLQHRYRMSSLKSHHHINRPRTGYNTPLLNNAQAQKSNEAVPEKAINFTWRSYDAKAMSVTQNATKTALVSSGKSEGTTSKEEFEEKSVKNAINDKPLKDPGKKQASSNSTHLPISSFKTTEKAKSVSSDEVVTKLENQKSSRETSSGTRSRSRSLSSSYNGPRKNSKPMLTRHKSLTIQFSPSSTFKWKTGSRTSNILQKQDTASLKGGSSPEQSSRLISASSHHFSAPHNPPIPNSNHRSARRSVDFEKKSQRDLHSSFARLYAAPLRSKSDFSRQYQNERFKDSPSSQATSSRLSEYDLPPKQIISRQLYNDRPQSRSINETPVTSVKTEVKSSSKYYEGDPCIESTQHVTNIATPKTSSSSGSNVRLNAISSVYSSRNRTSTDTKQIISLSDARVNSKGKFADYMKRHNTVVPLSTPFLSAEQLAIRESVEKVQRWMKTLPQHFESIQNVLQPVQQDY